jgi:hypothetical protein
MTFAKRPSVNLIRMYRPSLIRKGMAAGFLYVAHCNECCSYEYFIANITANAYFNLKTTHFRRPNLMLVNDFTLDGRLEELSK